MPVLNGPLLELRHGNYETRFHRQQHVASITIATIETAKCKICAWHMSVVEIDPFAQGRPEQYRERQDLQVQEKEIYTFSSENRNESFTPCFPIM
jgi:hypothetical protein